jgi:hypothetical protein
MLNWFLMLFGSTLATGLLCMPFDRHFGEGVNFGGQLILFVVCALVMSCFFSLGVPTVAGKFVIFQYQLRERLEMGEFIMAQVHRLARLYCVVYGVVLLIGTAIAGWQFSAGIAILSYCIAHVVVAYVIEMEIIRIGASVFFMVLKQYFEKNTTGFLQVSDSVE